MVLGYWRRPAAVAELAREVFHPGTDLYGVWPAAILAAGRRGIAGYLLRFPDWAAAAWCLARGLPVIASVRYASGELTGAAAAATPGHLLVLTGFEDGVVAGQRSGGADRGRRVAALRARRAPARVARAVGGWLRPVCGRPLTPIDGSAGRLRGG